MTNGASTSDAAPQDPHLGEITDFLGLRPTDDELRWLMPVTFDVAGATGTLHGGCGLAAAVAALETVTGRPMAAASAQYLARLSEGSCAAITLDIVRIFAESGELLATGNQSFAITRITGPLGSLAE